jgi:hypothetical protein
LNIEEKNKQLVILSIFCPKTFWSYFFSNSTRKFKTPKYLHFGSVSGKL